MSRLHLFKNYYLGTGLISVVGTSFATLSTANAVRLRQALPAEMNLTCYADIQRHVHEWYLSFHNGSGRHRDETALS